VLEVAGPYLGPCPSVQTDWTPLNGPRGPFDADVTPDEDAGAVWQFESFLLGADACRGVRDPALLSASVAP